MAAELHAFFDKDVFIKLACCDLWDDTLVAIGVTHPYRLASATPNGCKTAFRRMKLPDNMQDKALADWRRWRATCPLCLSSGLRLQPQASFSMR